MRTPLATTIAALLAFTLAAHRPAPTDAGDGSKLELGAFSVSLAVKDIAASRSFYEKLGFAVVMGEQAQGWLILRNGSTTIGIFQGVLPGNGLTFNPGWDAQAKPLASFEDVRSIQQRLEAAGVKLITRADESSTGPASFTLVDPDGNAIVVDQHVPKPKQ